MRIYIRGPSIGPVRTTLGSSGRRKRSQAGRLRVFAAVVVTSWAYETSPVLGVASTVILAVIAAFAVRRAWRAL